MAKFDVIGWKDFTHAARLQGIEADTAAEALTKAAQMFEDGEGDYEPVDDGGEPIHYMLAVDPDSDEEKGEWQSEKEVLHAKAGKLFKFAEMIARFVKDRERDDNGDIFDMPNDDAVETLHSVIDEARALTGIAARPNEDDPGTNRETETAVVKVSA